VRIQSLGLSRVWLADSQVMFRA